MYEVNDDGHWSDNYAGIAGGCVAPGFCIMMKQPEYTVIIDAGEGNITPDANWNAYVESVHVLKRTGVKEGETIQLPTNEPEMLGTVISYVPTGEVTQTTTENFSTDVSGNGTGPSPTSGAARHTGIVSEILGGTGKKRRKQIE